MPDMFSFQKQTVDISSLELSGRILDIGGGGEGVLSRRLGQNVVAIDKRMDELLESPDIGLKIEMDACDLKFPGNTFDHAACFFSLLYMEEGEIRKAVQEIGRVLVPGGRLWIWDAVIPSKPPAEVILVPLNVVISSDTVLTPTYGVGWQRGQSPESVSVVCREAGFLEEKRWDNGTVFELCLIKP